MMLIIQTPAGGRMFPGEKQMQKAQRQLRVPPLPLRFAQGAVGMTVVDSERLICSRSSSTADFSLTQAEEIAWGPVRSE